MKTIAQEAYELLSPIPKEDFITGFFTDHERKCCSLGHYSRLKSSDPMDYSFENCSNNYYPLSNVVETYLTNTIGKYFTAVEVNDTNRVNEYTEDNPKDRVVHLLKDMVEAGY